MDIANVDTGFWIILVLVGLIFGIIGFFIGKTRSNTTELEGNIKELKIANNQLHSDLDNCQEKLDQQSEQIGQRQPQFNAKAAQSSFGRFVKQDDLKIVEGIGPKIEGLFHNYNIKTWKSLSDASVAKCREVLQSGGEKYRVHDPASWPMQAKMCYEGKWKELYRWQEEHKHGKL
ncbi:MAG: hypothetical protein ACR2MM_09895 [Flavobacteriaceae bacterium]